MDLFILQRNFLARGIDTENFRLNYFYVPLLQNFQAPADIPWLALAEHQEEKGRHKKMLGAPIDENDVVIYAKLSAQVSGRNYPAAAPAKDYDPFSFRRKSHVDKSRDAWMIIFLP